MEAILTTKLFILPTRPDLVPCPRLLEQLSDGLHYKITPISAPAGFDKTTLVSGWVTKADPPVPTAWLSMDKDENDPTRFLVEEARVMLGLKGLDAVNF